MNLKTKVSMFNNHTYALKCNKGVRVEVYVGTRSLAHTVSDLQKSRLVLRCGGQIQRDTTIKFKFIWLFSKSAIVWVIFVDTVSLLSVTLYSITSRMLAMSLLHYQWIAQLAEKIGYIRWILEALVSWNCLRIDPYRVHQIWFCDLIWAHIERKIDFSFLTLIDYQSRYLQRQGNSFPD